MESWFTWRAIQIWIFFLSWPFSYHPLDEPHSHGPDSPRFKTMDLEGGGYLYHKMTPPPNLCHSRVVFEVWYQILPSAKFFRHEFEQSCSAMVTQKLEEKVQQHDEVVESSKTGCRSQSRAHGKAEQVPALYLQTSKVDNLDVFFPPPLPRTDSIRRSPLFCKWTFCSTKKVKLRHGMGSCMGLCSHFLGFNQLFDKNLTIKGFDIFW